ncbi:MAG: class I SAM-dependent methyltransferase [Candidatus Magasanikbacteria bacterium]
MKWDKIYETKGVVQNKPLSICKKLYNILPNKKLNILDLGCGTGRHSFLLANNIKWNIISLDNSQKALNYIEDKAKIHNLKNITTVNANFEKIPFKENEFDVIISTKAIHHGTFNTMKIISREINRVLKPGGLLLLVVPSIKDFRSNFGDILEDYNTRVNCPALIDPEIPHHFFTKDELQTLFNYKSIYFKTITRSSVNGFKKVTYFDLIFKK